MKKTLIFTYGLLMEEERQMYLSSDYATWRDGLAEVNHFEDLGPATIPDFRVVDCDPRTIIEAPKEKAAGRLYRVPDTLMPRLDGFEGCRGDEGRDGYGMYFRRTLVTTCGQTVEAWQMTDRIAKHHIERAS